ncbi:hypothetical protein Hanom_Chr09g00795981 [Helianthus anomalus]
MTGEATTAATVVRRRWDMTNAEVAALEGRLWKLRLRFEPPQKLRLHDREEDGELGLGSRSKKKTSALAHLHSHKTRLIVCAHPEFSYIPRFLLISLVFGTHRLYIIVIVLYFANNPIRTSVGVLSMFE